MKSLMHHEYVSIGSQNATHRIILIHGWGADANDLLEIGKFITHNFSYNFEIIALRGRQSRPNDDGRQWYSLFPADWDEAKKEVEYLVETLKEFGKQNISLEKTILLGFSQGAAMALDAGFRLNLGMIISCSGYAHPDWIPARDFRSSLLISHGLRDNVVPPAASKEIFDKVKARLSFNCKLYEFDGDHEIDPNFINLIRTKILEKF